MKVRLHNFIEKADTLGPGMRCCVWFQGCCRNCKGCMTPESQSVDGGFSIEVDELVENILSTDSIEGITVSGGEPFCQSKALFELLKAIKAKSDLGVIIYTGYYLDELKDMNLTEVDEIITSLADLIVDGPYIEALNDNKSMRGSANQNFHFITSRYQEQADTFGVLGRKVAIQVRENKVDLVGIPGKSVLEKWKTVCQKLSGKEYEES